MVLGFTMEELPTRGTTNENIEIIKQWLPKENLPSLTKEQILLFLIKAEEDVDKAKVTIKTCYECKKSLPKVFNNRKLDQSFHDVMQICAMPRKTKDGNVIIYICLLDTDYKHFNLDEFFKAFFMSLEAEVYHEPIKGIILIINMEGGGWMHFTKLKFGTMKDSIIYLQDGIPVEIKEIHTLNTLGFVDKVLTILGPFLSKSFLNKTKFHRKGMSWKEFHEKYVPKEYLPLELGGLVPSTRQLHEEYIKKLNSLEDYFLREEMQRFN